MNDELRRGALIGALTLFTSVCALNDVGQIDAFARLPLVDQKGQSFTLQSLHGTPVVLTFVASRCTDTCPIVNALFARLADRAAHAKVRVRLLTVTLDPSYDRPMVMSRLASTFRADHNRWRFATGSPRDVAALERAFGVVAETGASGVPETHSTFAYVLDDDGRIRRTLPFFDGFPEAVLRGVQRTN